MDNHRIAPLVLALMLLAGCAVQKPQVIVRDSVRVEYRDRIVRDTVNYEIPVEVERIITRDTTSHLENDRAVSDATVSNGFLFHSLRTKGGVIKVPVAVHVTDTLIVEKEAEIRTETQYVEKKLSWAQRLKIGAFWWLLALALVGWRREIIAGVKYIIKLF